MCFHTHAEENNTIVWTDVILFGSLHPDNKWKYFIQPQLRWIDRDHKLEQAIFRSGIGYACKDSLLFWIGEQLHASNQVNGNPPLGYIWERADYRVLNYDNFKLWGRTQFDERRMEGRSTWSIRLRERVSFLFPNTIHHKISPLIYNEVFFYLNKMNWSKNDENLQNRFFAGVNIPWKRSAFWEVGYFNQSFFRASENRINSSGNRVNNGIYLSLIIDL
ncbi:MAG: DUF2490 domain-containing protein [Gammaproteobacteria bacterium]